jgi:hypothetical protein
MQPTVVEGTVCITVSIETLITQGEWGTDEAIAAMKQALVLSTGVPMDSITVNYADQLCQASLTLSSNPKPTNNRRTLAMESILTNPSVPSQRNLSLESVHDNKLSIVRIAAHTSTSQQVQFSVVLQVSGSY